MSKLILELRRLLIVLIVIDAEDTRRQISVEEKAAALWRKVSGAGVTGNDKR